MIIRYFGAAQAAAGTGEEILDLPNGGTLAGVLDLLAVRHPAPPEGSQAPALAAVISRSSFLVNEVAARDHAMKLIDADVVDILPPFAGG